MNKNLEMVISNFKLIYDFENIKLNQSENFKEDGDYPILIKVKERNEKLFVISMLIQNITKTNLIMINEKNEKAFDKKIKNLTRYKNINSIFSLFTHENDFIIIQKDKRIGKVSFEEIFEMNQFDNVKELERPDRGEIKLEIGIPKSTIENLYKVEEWEKVIMVLCRCIEELKNIKNQT